MKQMMTLFCIAAFSLTLLAGCSEDTPAPTTEAAKPSTQTAPAAAPEAAPGKTGKVTESMDAAGYTYVQVDTGAEQFWAAAPQFAVQVGDDVVVPEGMPMPDYHSKTLDRTFDMVYFVPSVMVGGAQAMSGDMPSDHPSMDGGKTVVEETTVDLSGITVAEGGVTIEDMFTKKAELAGKSVSVRGKVVKFTPEIMGKNWIHLQDGTGAEGTSDLTVTTSATAKMGDTVTVSGVVVIDKDFGYGYAYDVIIEDAEVTVE